MEPSFWWSFGFDGLAGDTRDSYPIDGAGAAGTTDVSPALMSSHMALYSLVRLDAIVIAANSAGGNILLRRASDGVLLHTIACPVPSRQPLDAPFRAIRIEGPGGFTLASDQSIQVLSVIAAYSLLELT